MPDENGKRIASFIFDIAHAVARQVIPLGKLLWFLRAILEAPLFII